MIPSQTENKVETYGGNFKTSFFAIDPANIGHILKLLRTDVYKDKIGTPIREYIANAVDANRDSGNADRSVIVHAPNSLEPFFSVRDFGPGLDEDGIRKTFASYGCSTKRNTNDRIGSFGIGSKSGFAYSDEFVVRSYLNGKRYDYTCVIDETQVGQVILVLTEDTDEENGLEVEIPVQHSDFATFAKKIKYYCCYISPIPNVVGNQSAVPSQIEYAFVGDKWGFRSHNLEDYVSNSYVIMGGVPYPIQDSSLRMSLSDAKLDIFCEIGEVDIALSREDLTYTPKTINWISDAIKEAKAEFCKKFQADFPQGLTPWEFGCHYVKAVATLPNYARSWVTVDFPLPQGKNFRDYNARVVTVQRLIGNGPLSGIAITGSIGSPDFTSYSSIPFKSDQLFIINDLEMIRPVAKAKQLQNDKNCSSFIMVSKEDARCLIDDWQVPDEQFTNLSEIKVVRKNSNRSKNTSKILLFNRGNWHSIPRFWTDASVDLDNLRGVYINVSGYNCVTKNDKEGPRAIESLLSKLSGLGINIPPIYGVRSGKKVKSHSAIEFGEWVYKKLFKYCTDNKTTLVSGLEEEHLAQETQISAGFIEKTFKTRLTDLSFDSDFTDLFSLYDKAKALGTRSPQRIKAEQYKEAIKVAKNFLGEIRYTEINVEILEQKPELQQSVEKIRDTILDKYPLLKVVNRLSDHSYYHHLEAREIDHIIEYCKKINS
jgi:hypothetical protein